MIQDLTPILIVDSIEDQLPFYEGALGFAQAMAVPHGDRLGFVGLVRDGRMIMLQTHASLAADLPGAARHLATHKGASILYAVVDSLGDAAAALDQTAVVQPQRETFYGMREMWFRDPASNLLGLAQKLS